MSEAEQFVKNYLIERGADPDPIQWREYDMIASGIIDSFETLSFILEINTRFHLSIAAHDFIDSGLNKVGTLVKYVEKNERKAEQ